jgi:DNA-binding FadR family transcriptional regulator
MGSALTDLIDVRSAVEPKVAELAAQRADAGSVARLRQLLERFRKAQVTDLRRGDSLLHIAIAQVASSDLLMDSVLKIQIRLHDLLAFLASTPTPKAAARHETRQHEKIVEAIASGNADAAHSAMATHLAATEELLSGLMKDRSGSAGRAAVERRAASTS